MLTKIIVCFREKSASENTVIKCTAVDVNTNDDDKINVDNGRIIIKISDLLWWHICPDHGHSILDKDNWTPKSEIGR